MANKTIKYCTLFLLCCLSFLCTSCFSEVDLGFPHKVSFPKEGGEMIITGEKLYFDATIRDYHGNSGHTEFGEDGIRYETFDWLKIEFVDTTFNEQLKLYVAPNTTNHRRKLYIDLWDDPYYQVVKVIQE